MNQFLKKAKGIIFDISKQSTVVKRIYETAHRLKILATKNISDEKYISEQFSQKLGYTLDLEHPRTFNEKTIGGNCMIDMTSIRRWRTNTG